MFTHFKSRDNTLENHVFHFSWLPAYLSDAIEQVQYCVLEIILL